MQITHYNGVELADAITRLGAKSSLLSVSFSANFIKYDFELQNLTAYTKLKNIALWLSKHLHENISLADGIKGDYCLKFARKEREIIPAEWAYKHSEQTPLTAIVGVGDIDNIVSIHLDDFVSGLCVGTSGSGKSTFLHSFLGSLTQNSTPKQLKLVLIDIKRTELTAYDGLAHLKYPVITDLQTANTTLKHLVAEMHNRYEIMQILGVTKLTDELPHILVVIDELAELMLSGDSEIQNSLIRLCQMGRACGMHCLLCTQSPRVAVVNGLIQSNTPTKFALRTSNTRESVLAIGHKGCETLLGKGDMLFKRADSVHEMRLQTPYATPPKIIPTRHETQIVDKVITKPPKVAKTNKIDRKTPTIDELNWLDCIDD